MMTVDDGRRQVERANETITRHIVGITGDIGEDEEDQKRFKTGSDNNAETADQPAPRTLTPAAPPGAVLGSDQVRDRKIIETLQREADARARKRKAEDEPGDASSGVWSNISREESSANPEGTSSGSGTKRSERQRQRGQRRRQHDWSCAPVRVQPLQSTVHQSQSYVQAPLPQARR